MIETNCFKKNDWFIEIHSKSRISITELQNVWEIVKKEKQLFLIIWWKWIFMVLHQLEIC